MSSSFAVDATTKVLSIVAVGLTTGYSIAWIATKGGCRATTCDSENHEKPKKKYNSSVCSVFSIILLVVSILGLILFLYSLVPKGQRRRFRGNFMRKKTAQSSPQYTVEPSPELVNDASNVASDGAPGVVLSDET